MPETNEEMIALLREIRDLQKAHFARYEEFTAIALKRQDEAAEARKQLTASTAQARESNRQYQLQTQQNLAETRAGTSRSRHILVICVVLQFLLTFFLILAIMMGRIRP